MSWASPWVGFSITIPPDAKERAEELLLEHLDEQQAADWQRQGRFTVTAPGGNRYEIQRLDGMVRSLDDRTAYCLQPTGTVPKADTALAHKLWLEADEQGFLAAANSFPSPNEWEGACFHQGYLHLETVEEARRWAEARNWDITVSIDRNTGLPGCFDRERDFILLNEPEPVYEVNDMVSDAHTVDLLRQVAMQRNVDGQD